MGSLVEGAFIARGVSLPTLILSVEVICLNGQKPLVQAEHSVAPAGLQRRRGSRLSGIDFQGRAPDLCAIAGRVACPVHPLRAFASLIGHRPTYNSARPHAMSEDMARRSVHYAWVVASVTFVILLVTAGVRATPGVLMLSLEREFGWSRAVISSAVAINIALFGIIGPFAASVMDRWGVRRVILAAVALLSASVALTTQMQSQWQLTLLWGVLVGIGHRRNVDGAGGDHRQSLVRRAARSRPRHPVGSQRDGAADLPAVTGCVSSSRMDGAPRHCSSPALPQSCSSSC